jgi:hypothetical protein
MSEVRASADDRFELGKIGAEISGNPSYECTTSSQFRQVVCMSNIEELLQVVVSKSLVTVCSASFS